MGISHAHAQKILDAHLGASASLLINPILIGLSTTTPNADGSNITEPIGNGYTREVVSISGTNWSPATIVDGIATKFCNGQIIFPEASGGGWGTVTHWVVYDFGVPAFWGEIHDAEGTPAPQLIEDGDRFRFLSGDFRITME